MGPLILAVKDLCRWINLRVCVKWEIVVEFDYSGMVKFFVDSVFSAGVSEKKCLQFSLKTPQRRTFYIVQIKTFQTGTKKRGSVVLVVVLLLLLPPVLVELMDFNGHIPQLCQIKSLKNNHYCYFSTKKEVKCNKVHAQAEWKLINIFFKNAYLKNFAKASSSE